MSKTNSAVKLTRKARGKEKVILFGTPADAEVKARANKIINAGREVEFKNLEHQTI